MNSDVRTFFGIPAYLSFHELNMQHCNIPSDYGCNEFSSKMRIYLQSEKCICRVRFAVKWHKLFIGLCVVQSMSQLTRRLIILRPIIHILRVDSLKECETVISLSCYLPITPDSNFNAEFYDV